MNPFQDAIEQEIAELRRSNNPADQQHLKNLQALIHLDQPLDAFRARCRCVPLIQGSEGQWQLAATVDQEQLRSQCMAAAETEEGKANFEGLLESILDMLERTQEPAIPLLSMHTAQWVIFHRPSGPRQETPSLPFRMMSLQAFLKENEDVPEDIVAWWFERLKRSAAASLDADD